LPFAHCAKKREERMLVRVQFQPDADPGLDRCVLPKQLRPTSSRTVLEFVVEPTREAYSLLFVFHRVTSIIVHNDVLI
jgi:hypothetical protein